MSTERSMAVDPGPRSTGTGQITHPITSLTPNSPFLGTSSSIQHLKEQALRVVNSNTPVLIAGERGSGKRTLARWLHDNGPHSAGLFVEVPCAGVADLKIETRIFGCEKGAFTASHTTPGLLEVARGGTILIGEISALSMALQEKIFAALEQKRFRRLGDTQNREVQTRIVATSRHNIAERVQAGRFHRGLHLLLGEALGMPPLRERAEDIPPLAAHLLALIAAEHEREPMSLSGTDLQQLQAFSWPGNVRELRDLLEHAMLRAGQGAAADATLARVVAMPQLQPSPFITLDEMEKEHIQKALRLEGGRVQLAAKKLGIPRSSLYHKLKQYGISRRGANSSPWEKQAGSGANG